ncbi:MAG: hypothetical protein ACLP6G_11960 [Terriglobales bacterium]
MNQLTNGSTRFPLLLPATMKLMQMPGCEIVTGNNEIRVCCRYYIGKRFQRR